VATRAVTSHEIDTAYTTGNFVRGIDAVSVPNALYLKAAVAFNVNDEIFACEPQRYFLSGTNLCLNNAGLVLAENIDSLYIVFLNKTNTETVDWGSMLTSRILVRARTALPDKRYSHPVFHDGYRRIELSIDFRLRNKF
jgi:hypothetical protein